MMDWHLLPAEEKQPEKETIWFRVGMSYTAPKGQIEALLSGKNKELPDLMKALKDGNAEIDGGTYIPEFVVEDYNYFHGTDFPVEELSWYDGQLQTIYDERPRKGE